MRRLFTSRQFFVALAVLGAFAACVAVAVAQTPPPSSVPTQPNLPRGSLELVSSRAFLLTVSLLLFGVIIIFLEFLLLRKRLNDRIDDLGKFFILTLIIIGTLVLVGAGFNADQIAPVIGLFGTVAGYLLGRNAPAQPPAGNEPPAAASRPATGAPPSPPASSGRSPAPDATPRT